MRLFSLPVSSYQAINIATGFLIFLVMAYSFFFGQPEREHPIECVHVAIHGNECQTCGLSQSFSNMVRGDYDSAIEFNRNGPLIFGFFVSQLFLRVFAGIVLYRGKLLKLKISPEMAVWPDAVISLTLFVICFRFLLLFW